MRKIIFKNEKETFDEIKMYCREDKEILLIFEKIEPYPLLSSYLINLYRYSKKEKFRLVLIVSEKNLKLDFFMELKKFIEIYSSVKDYENSKIYTDFEIKIYEDDIFVRKLMKSILIDNNFSIKERNLNNFFDKKHDCQYNSLYIIDFSKKKLKSIEEIKKINKKNEESIIVLLASEEDLDIALKYITIGVKTVIVKPFDPEEFIKVIKRLTIEAYFKRENKVLLEKITKSESEIRNLYNQINEELKLASDIQKSLFPNKEEIINNYEITHLFEPSLKIGGDFYENIKLNEKDVFIAFADISGHGIAASLLASMLKTSIQNRIYLLKNGEKEESLKVFLEVLNEDLIKVFPKGKFVSIFVAILDTENDELLYSKASQEPIFLIRNKENKILKLETEGFLLGMFSKKIFKDKIKFEVKNTKILKNDKIIFYTDGVTEIEDEKGNYFGDIQFQNILLENKDLENKEIIDKVLEKIKTFSKNNVIIDDISMLIINKKI